MTPEQTAWLAAAAEDASRGLTPAPCPATADAVMEQDDDGCPLCGYDADRHEPE